MILLYAIRWHIVPVCFIINDVYSDYLIKVVPASFPHCKLTNFSFVINKRFLWGGINTLEPCISCSSSSFYMDSLISFWKNS